MALNKYAHAHYYAIPVYKVEDSISYVHSQLQPLAVRVGTML
jgi:hypothetical protein